MPKQTFARLLALALSPPTELLKLPFTSTQPVPAECFVSLLIRPLVCPAISGFTQEKTMEVRFFVPGNLVSNLDFVEAIFENGGDPAARMAPSPTITTRRWTASIGAATRGASFWRRI